MAKKRNEHLYTLQKLNEKNDTIDRLFKYDGLTEIARFLQTITKTHLTKRKL